MELRKFLGKSFSFTLASISGYINKTKGKPNRVSGGS